MSDTFSREQILDIINDNIELNQGQDTSNSQDMIDEIFKLINSCNSLPAGRARVLKRTAYVFALITNRQRFSDYTRHSAFSAAVTFLRLNNLDLPLNEEGERGLFYLLDKTKSKSAHDVTLCQEFENYLSTKVIDRPRVIEYY